MAECKPTWFWRGAESSTSGSSGNRKEEWVTGTRLSFWNLKSHPLRHTSSKIAIPTPTRSNLIVSLPMSLPFTFEPPHQLFPSDCVLSFPGPFLYLLPHIRWIRKLNRKTNTLVEFTYSAWLLLFRAEHESFKTVEQHPISSKTVFS